MGLRVTTSMLLRNALANVSRARAQLARTQEQVASGLRINRPADDPVGVRAALLLRSGLDANEQYQRNITRTRPRVSAAETAIGNANDLLISARELAMDGANDHHSAESRALLAGQVEALHARLLSEANTRVGGGYIFAGTANDADAFTAGSFPSPVSFDGNTTEIQVEIEEGVTVTATLNGQRVFLGDADGNGAPDANREDIFDVLQDLHAALLANDGQAVSDLLPRISGAMDQLSEERTRIGSVETQLDAFDAKLQQREVDLTKRLSDVQDADAAEVISNLIQQETALRVSLDATARMVQPSLLDFLS